ncbi:unnamed protein product, partial [Rotaria sordida]
MHEIDCYAEHPQSSNYISFDIDALNPTVAASIGILIRVGLTFCEGHCICEALHATGRL